MGKGIPNTTGARAWKHEPGDAFRKLQAFDVAGAWSVYEGIERDEAGLAGRPWWSIAFYDMFRFYPEDEKSIQKFYQVSGWLRLGF